MGARRARTIPRGLGLEAAAIMHKLACFQEVVAKRAITKPPQPRVITPSEADYKAVMGKLQQHIQVARSAPHVVAAYTEHALAHPMSRAVSTAPCVQGTHPVCGCVPHCWFLCRHLYMEVSILCMSWRGLM